MQNQHPFSIETPLHVDRAPQFNSRTSGPHSGAGTSITEVGSGDKPGDDDTMYSETANSSETGFVDLPAAVLAIREMVLLTQRFDNTRISERFSHSERQFAIPAVEPEQSLQYGQVVYQRDVDFFGMGSGFVTLIGEVGQYPQEMEIDEVQQYSPNIVVDEEMKYPEYEDPEVMIQTTL